MLSSWAPFAHVTGRQRTMTEGGKGRSREVWGGRPEQAPWRSRTPGLWCWEGRQGGLTDQIGTDVMTCHDPEKDQRRGSSHPRASRPVRGAGRSLLPSRAGVSFGCCRLHTGGLLARLPLAVLVPWRGEPHHVDLRDYAPVLPGCVASARGPDPTRDEADEGRARRSRSTDRTGRHDLPAGISGSLPRDLRRCSRRAGSARHGPALRRRKDDVGNRPRAFPLEPLGIQKLPRERASEVATTPCPGPPEKARFGRSRRKLLGLPSKGLRRTSDWSSRTSRGNGIA